MTEFNPYFNIFLSEVCKAATGKLYRWLTLRTPEQLIPGGVYHIGYIQDGEMHLAYSMARLIGRKDLLDKEIEQIGWWANEEGYDFASYFEKCYDASRVFWKLEGGLSESGTPVSVILAFRREDAKRWVDPNE